MDLIVVSTLSESSIFFHYFHVGSPASGRKDERNVMFLFWLLMLQCQIFWASTSCPRMRFRGEHAGSIIGYFSKNLLICSLYVRIHNRQRRTFIIAKAKNNDFENISTQKYFKASLYAGSYTPCWRCKDLAIKYCCEVTQDSRFSHSRAPGAWLFWWWRKILIGSQFLLNYICFKRKCSCKVFPLIYSFSMKIP